MAATRMTKNGETKMVDMSQVQSHLDDGWSYADLDSGDPVTPTSTTPEMPVIEFPEFDIPEPPKIPATPTKMATLLTRETLVPSPKEGRRGTILTGPQGVPNQPVAKKQLIGAM